MKRKVLIMSIIFSALICFITCLFSSSVFSEPEKNSDDIRGEQIVALNEIEQLAKSGKINELSQKCSQFEESIKNVQLIDNSPKYYGLMGGICVVFVFAVFGYVYFRILKPFDRMKIFAEKIAQGDFDIPLKFQRTEYFGEFTWAFDSMRREITKARACEKEAIDNNKTVIATLSHDIKTPIASIRAYAEGLQANLAGTVEKREKYLSVLMRKCDEVSKLTNDLFLHSVSDLDKLKINCEKIEICSLITKITDELSGENNDINFFKPEFSACVMADKNRFIQIMENIINNSRKYAKTEIDVSVTKLEGNINIIFKDYGNGIPDEDMPFITEKFYSGKNCGNEQGSGLGLYIVNYIIQQMNGKLFLHNLSQGLEVTISLPEINFSS